MPLKLILVSFSASICLSECSQVVGHSESLGCTVSGTYCLLNLLPGREDDRNFYAFTELCNNLLEHRPNVFWLVLQEAGALEKTRKQKTMANRRRLKLDVHTHVMPPLPNLTYVHIRQELQKQRLRITRVPRETYGDYCPWPLTSGFMKKSWRVRERAIEQSDHIG